MADLLQAGLAELDLDGEEMARLVSPLEALAELAAAWATRMNLTGHRSAEGVARHLILGAIAVGRLLSTPSRLVDLGSGAGFPGLPLAVLWPRTDVLLVEARERRHHFQRQAVRRLGLERVEPVLGRAEDLPPRPAPLVISQAIAPPSEALRWMLRWAAPGGTLALPLASPIPELVLPQGVARIRVHTYALPLDGGSRSLWLGERLLPLDSPSGSV